MSAPVQATRPERAGAGARRIGRLEPAALAGVMSRDVSIFGRYWKATTFASVVQPTIYLLAFGLGFKSFVPHLLQVSYVQYVATGVVATAILFSSAFPGMFNTFVRWQFQRTYDAMLAAPVDVEELITAEVLWISIRAGVYGLAPLLVGFAFGLEPEFGMLLVPLIGFVTGFGFAAFGVTVDRADDRQLQLHNERRADADVPRRRHLLPGFEPAVGHPRRCRGQPALPLRAARPRRVAGSSARRRPRAHGGARRVRADHVAAGDLPAGPPPDRLTRLRNSHVSQTLLLPAVAKLPR
jgi:hypothetical protein